MNFLHKKEEGIQKSFLKEEEFLVEFSKKEFWTEIFQR